jgi:2-oxoglutarate dehydrogenase E2 component (dihydrolipoamide succinyltransferase)
VIAPATATNSGGSLQVKVPTVGESITEVTLSRWIKKDGDQVAMDEAIAELESDKATFELTAEKAGVLKTIAKEGDVLPIGAVVCTIEGAGASTVSAPKTAEPVAASATASAPTTSSEKTYASGTPSPAAAKILAEKGINPASVPGNGVDGRITKADALIAVNADLVSENPQGGKK